MSDDPLVWHYGLMAERWAENTEAREAPFFIREVARHGQPALDLGCGTGRVLLHLLRAGIDIDGCDISGDMLRHCRARAAGEGFAPRLYQRTMHAFDLPRKYRTIYVCDSFGLAGGRDKDLEMLRRCHAHLEDGGALLLNVQMEYTTPAAWEMWLKEKHGVLPQPWPEQGRAQTGADGSENIARFRYLEINPLEQSYTRQVRLEKRRAGALITSEEYTLRGDMYLKHEVLLMLKVAGFRQITVRGDYTEQPPTSDSEEVVFTAIR